MSRSGFSRRGALGLGVAGAAACAAPNVETPAYAGEIAFNHGVASGDPRQDRVVIWTRVTPSAAGPVPVRWIVARNRELSDVVKTGVVETTEARDYTVKVDVLGLRAGAPYFYGFRAGQAESPVGRTRTLPRGRAARAKIAVASCASYPHGFFNAYDAIAREEELDLVVHLGDYIYEYGVDGYGGDRGMALGRVPSPQVECTRLEDYRARHAQYKQEAELQAAHAAAPWIVVWDDHEASGNAFTAGAEDHQMSDGDWAARKAAAIQAYYEWMPIRDPEPGRAFEAINRSFDYGDLFTLIMLETRLLARSEQFPIASIPIERRRWDFSDPSAPVAMRANQPDGPATRELPSIYEDVNGEMQPVLDWRRLQGLIAQAPNLPSGFYFKPDVAALDAVLRAPGRTLLGEAQERWLADELSRSRRRGAAWQVLGNQVLLAPLNAPDVSAAPPALLAALERLLPGVSRLIRLTRFPFPINLDSWDGYPASRDRVLAMLRQAGASALVLTGDTHTAWANEVSDAQGRVAVELGATSITSPSESDYFAPVGMDFGAAVRARNPHVKFHDGIGRGYLRLTLTPERALAEYMTVSAIQSRQYEIARTAAWAIARDEAGGIGEIGPA